MKKNKNLFVCLMLAGILLVSVLIGTVAARRQETPASKELTVVTSFYPMYIATENVIGDATDVRLENLSEPQTGCLHDFQLTPEDIPFIAKQTGIVLKNCGKFDAESLNEYIASGGFQALEKAMFEMDPDLVIDQVDKSGIRGRGGGGFPAGKKWIQVARQADPVHSFRQD